MQVIQNTLYNHGMAGALALQFKDRNSTPYYDNLRVSALR